MSNINCVVLSGNLTSDPELRHTQGGTPVCNMRIAVNGRESVNGEWRDRADFFDVTVWGKRGESCAQYLHRGSPVAISGRLRLEEWTPKGGGDKRSRVVVVADTVQFLPSRDGGGGRDAAAVPDGEFAVPQGDFSTPTDQDIPF